MNIYFSGIAGTGIGPLAEIALDAGYNVTGSDLSRSKVSDELSGRGVNISYNQDGSFLEAIHSQQSVDWLVYTSALPQDHPELIMAQKLGIKTSKRDEFLAKIMEDKNLKLVAIAGTHGKTTTSSMLVYVMQKLQIPISYLVGTTLSFGPSGKYDPNSKYFIYECDEYDRNFLNFHPFLSAITSIDYDHPDTYPTKTDYLNAFKQFAANSQQVIGWQSQHGEIFDGLDQINLINDADINQNIKLAGEHNRKNATLAQKVLIRVGIDNATDEIFSNYPGSARRFEKLLDNLYSDYGHHPTEISATLELASELSDHIVLVYQPHQNIRQHQIYKDYTNQFERAEIIYWLPTYLTRENPDLKILSPEELTSNIMNKQSVVFCELNNDLLQKIRQHRQDGKLVLIMGAGTIDDWMRNHLSEV